jgi:hypothetical protein
MIHEKISAYFGEVAGDPHHRYRSWEHCYRFFRELTPSGIAAQRKSPAVSLVLVFLLPWAILSLPLYPVAVASLYGAVDKAAHRQGRRCIIAAQRHHTAMQRRRCIGQPILEPESELAGHVAF